MALTQQAKSHYITEAGSAMALLFNFIYDRFELSLTLCKRSVQ